MKNSTRWVLFLVGAAALIIGVYYFVLPSWPVYPMIGWRSHHFGPRTFPWAFLLWPSIALMIGFAFYKLLFPSSGSQSTRVEEDYCPYCGREFERSESISGIRPEGHEKEKVSQWGVRWAKKLSLPRWTAVVIWLTPGDCRVQEKWFPLMIWMTPWFWIIL